MFAHVQGRQFFRSPNFMRFMLCYLSEHLALDCAEVSFKCSAQLQMFWEDCSKYYIITCYSFLQACLLFVRAISIKHDILRAILDVNGCVKHHEHSVMQCFSQYQSKPVVQDGRHHLYFDQNVRYARYKKL